MFTRLKILNAEQVETLINICENLMPLTELDTSNYATGRKRLWLFNKINLKTSEVSLGLYIQELWELSQSFGCNVGLMSYGGKNLDSTGLINWHRDHVFAMERNVTVNIGICTFGYDNNRRGGIHTDTNRDRHIHLLTTGEVIEFNCKHPHALLSIDSPKRIGLNFWTLNESKGFKSLVH